MILYSWEYQNKFFIMYKRFLFIVKSLTKLTMTNALKKSWKRKTLEKYLEASYVLKKSFLIVVMEATSYPH